MARTVIRIKWHLGLYVCDAIALGSNQVEVEVEVLYKLDLRCQVAQSSRDKISTKLER
jgi:hypothetical protein